MSAGLVVILTGPPGSGKTTVAALLTGNAPQPSVHLRTDDFWHAIKRGWIAPYRSEAHGQNEVVIGVLADAAFGYARGGYEVVVDGIVGPWFLDPFLDRARGTGVPLHYVVLRPKLGVALDRARTRADSSRIASEPIRSLYKQLSWLGPLESGVIDTTNQAAGETASAVRDLVGSGTARVDVGQVDT